jgi:hypothetical protein
LLGEACEQVGVRLEVGAEGTGLLNAELGDQGADDELTSAMATDWSTPPSYATRASLSASGTSNERSWVSWLQKPRCRTLALAAEPVLNSCRVKRFFLSGLSRVAR